MNLNKIDYIVKSSKELIEIGYFKNENDIADALSKGEIFATYSKNGFQVIPINLLEKNSYCYDKKNSFILLIDGFEKSHKYGYEASIVPDTSLLFYQIGQNSKLFNIILRDVQPQFSSFSTFKLLRIELPDIYFNYNELLNLNLHKDTTIGINLCIYNNSIDYFSPFKIYRLNLILSELTKEIITWKLVNYNNYDNINLYDAFDSRLLSIESFSNLFSIHILNENIYKTYFSNGSFNFTILEDRFLFRGDCANRARTWVSHGPLAIDKSLE
jgi:hypothetical protein